jgi:hypothetical protein
LLQLSKFDRALVTDMIDGAAQEPQSELGG